MGGDRDTTPVAELPLCGANHKSVPPRLRCGVAVNKNLWNLCEIKIISADRNKKSVESV